MHDSLVLCSPDKNATGKQLPLIFADGRVHPSLFLCFVKLSRHETQQAPGRRPPKRSRQMILCCCCSDRMTIPIQEKHEEASVVGNSVPLLLDKGALPSSLGLQAPEQAPGP